MTKHSRHIEHVPEHMNRAGASMLAKRIEQYWSSRGYPHVAARVIEEKLASRYRLNPPGPQLTICVVRSNLVNGLPPIYATLAAAA